MKTRNTINVNKLHRLTVKIFRTKNILHHFDKIVFANKEIDIKDTILVAGTPRSGTTWLMEVMAAIPRYTYLFEPLQPRWFPESVKVGFQSRPYLPLNADWPEGEEYLRKTFTGRVVSLRPSYQLKPEMIMYRLLSDKLAIKSVRLNRLLPWIARKFQLRKIIFIIRHPCAVVASQIKTGYCGYRPPYPPYIDIFPNLENILDEASKIDGLDSELLNRLRRIKTQEEILAAVWCLDNYVPLSLPKPYPWTTVIYEKLVKEGEKEVERLFNEIGETGIPQSMNRHLKLPRILTLERELKVVTKADQQLSKWKKALSEKQIDRILKIVSDFGLDFYTEELEPDYKNISIL